MNIEQSYLPVFQTNRLILRDVQPNDIESYQRNFADYEVIQHLSAQVPWPYPDNGVQYFIDNIIRPVQGKTRWLWVITQKSHPEEVIGAIDLWRNGIPEHRGFWLAKKYWGKGYMTEAVYPVTNYAFETLNFERLVFSNAVGNTRSRRIKEKTGAVYLGTRKAAFKNPDYTEAETWELSRERWMTQRANIDWLVQKPHCNSK